MYPSLASQFPSKIEEFFTKRLISDSQPFWADMIYAAGAGPPPIPQKFLDAENLADAIRYCLTPAASVAALDIAAKMRSESGVKAAVESFHSHLSVEQLRCDVLKNQPASWVYKGRRNRLRLSKVAAEILVDHLKIDRLDLKMCVIVSLACCDMD